MKWHSKDIIIIILGITVVIFAFLYFSKSEPVYDKELIEKQVDDLKKRNEILNKEITEQANIILDFRNQIDSLENVKNKEIIKYVEKSNEIDAANVSDVISEFNGIFTNNGIK